MSFANLMKSIPSGGRIKVPGGVCQGFTQTDQTVVNARVPKYAPTLGKGSEYAAKYKAEEEKMFLESMANSSREVERSDVTKNSAPSNLFEPEDLTSVGTLPNVKELETEDLTQVYSQYAFQAIEPTEQLMPIHNEREEILKLIDSFPVCIIRGPTGCGKSTQIPQFILDDHAKRRQHCNIIVTQPRRIAAITIAQHVCEQRDWPVGSLVGYQVGLEKNANEDTRLLYCTTGVLLEKLIMAKELNQYTHILLDEVHEREEDMDFAMLIIRKFLRTNSPHVKIVLMSATIDPTRFAKYFEFYMANERSPAPVLDIELERKFDVQVYYLDALKKYGNIPDFKTDDPGIAKELYDLVLVMIQGFNTIDANDFKEKRCLEEKGAVLIFLPGLYQIESLYETLLNADNSSNNVYNLWLCPLHSSITKDEQEKVRKYAPHGKRKVILSTNIAESSITIPDVKYVIDFCLTKHLMADTVTGLSSLKLTWASHTNCIQREGRVGRVQDGRVYRMVPRSFYLYNMRKECVPEMQRCPLEIIVLKCKKLMEKECPLKLISNALDPPDLDNYEKTIHKLKEIGAMLTTCAGEESIVDGDITFMGRVMASLPLDIHITKLILLGHIFGVQEEAIIMGCSMSVRNVFSEPFQKRLDAYNNKLLWADSSESDSVAYLNAYLVWRQQTAVGKFQRAKSSEEGWARRYMLQIKYLREVAKLEDEIKRRLKAFNIVEIRHHSSPLWHVIEKPLILKLVLAGAFYPHYFSTRSIEKSNTCNLEVEAVKQLSSHAPQSSVYVQNMPHPAPLYFDQLTESLRNYGIAQDFKLHYDDTRKVIIEFETKHRTSLEVGGKNLHSNIPGDIAMPVYRAVKLRQLNSPIIIRPMKPEVVQEKLMQLSLCSKTSSMSLVDDFPPMIRPEVDLIEVIVTFVIDPSEFYCQLVDFKVKPDEVKHTLTRFSKYLKPLTSDWVENFIYAAPYKDESGIHYYRAKVTGAVDSHGDRCVRVFFIDYGNSSVIKIRDLREMSNEKAQRELDKIPPLAIKCKLAKVKPSMWVNEWDEWSDAAIACMEELVYGRKMLAQVYSFVEGVAALEVYIDDNPNPSETDLSTLNEKLVKEKLAQPREEPYFSKMDHNRKQDAKREFYQGHASQIEISKSLKLDPLSLPMTKGRTAVQLKGPHSPLEMKLHSLVRCSIDKDVRTEWNSVNSVLLDSEPEDPRNKWMVAGSVAQSADGCKLTLNHTTVLPNMPGLGTLVCLIFAPRVELRTDENYSRYTGALCGLGLRDCDSEIFYANDMEINFDVEFTNDDFLEVNKLRYWLNDRFCGDDADDMSEGRIQTIQKNIKIFIRKLLKRSRPTCAVYSSPTPFRWNQIPESRLCHPFPDVTLQDFSKDIYQLLYGVDIDPENDRDNIRQMLDKTLAMKRALDNGVTPRYLLCELCETHFDYVPQLRDHLDSKRHIHLLDWLQKRGMALNPPVTPSKV